MKRLIRTLAMGFLAFAGGLAAGRAELVARQADSVFDVEGLMVDFSEPVSSSEVFRAGIKKYPLIEPRQSFMTSRPYEDFQPVIRSGHIAQGAVRASVVAADNYAKERNWAQALAETQQGLELDPDNLFLVRRAAAFAALSRNFSLADEYFQKALAAYPDSVAFLTGRAGVLIRMLKLKEADQLVQRALAIDPTFLAARFDALCLQIARGEKDVPEGGWDKLTVENVLELANWLDADKQDYVKALQPEGYKKLCSIVLGPGTDARVSEIVGSLNAANEASRAGQWGAAAEALSKVKSAGVRALGIDVNLGRSLYQKGDKSAAVAHFKAMADRYPNDDSVLYDYAYVLINMELYSEASQVLERACELDPQDGQAAFALACSYSAVGQMDKAWPILTRLASSHAADMPVWMTGDKPYQEAIRKDPRYAELKKSFEPAQPGTP